MRVNECHIHYDNELLKRIKENSFSYKQRNIFLGNTENNSANCTHTHILIHILLSFDVLK